MQSRSAGRFAAPSLARGPRGKVGAGARAATRPAAHAGLAAPGDSLRITLPRRRASRLGKETEAERHAADPAQRAVTGEPLFSGSG